MVLTNTSEFTQKNLPKKQKDVWKSIEIIRSGS
jgi:hypothetical protein